jgi:hypothetical protein
MGSRIVAVFMGLFKAVGVTALVLLAIVGGITVYESYQDYIEKAGVSTSSGSGISVMPNVVTYSVPDSSYKNAPMLTTRDEYRRAALQQMPQGNLVSLIGEVIQIIEPNIAVISTGMQVAGTSILDAVVLGYSGQNVLVRFPDRPPYIIGDITTVKGQYLGVKEMTSSVEGVADFPVVDADYWLTGRMDELDSFLKNQTTGFSAR